MRYYLTLPVWSSSKSVQIIKAGEGVDALITLEIPRVWELCVRNKAEDQIFVSYYKLQCHGA